MRRAGEARVVTPDANLDAVEDSFGNFPVFDILAGYVEYGRGSLPGYYGRWKRLN